MLVGLKPAGFNSKLISSYLLLSEAQATERVLRGGLWLISRRTPRRLCADGIKVSLARLAERAVEEKIEGRQQILSSNFIKTLPACGEEEFNGLVKGSRRR